MNDSIDATFAASYLDSTSAYRPILICGGYCDGDGAAAEPESTIDVAGIHDEVAGR